MKSLPRLFASNLTKALVLLPILIFLFSSSQVNGQVNSTWRCNRLFYPGTFSCQDNEASINYFQTVESHPYGHPKYNPETWGCFVSSYSGSPKEGSAINLSCECTQNCSGTNPEPSSNPTSTPIPSPTPSGQGGIGGCGFGCDSTSQCHSGLTCQDIAGQICWDDAICGGDPNPTAPPASDNPSTPTNTPFSLPPVPTELTNPSFETGNFSGWELHGLTAQETFVVDSQMYPPGNDGRYYAKLVRTLDAVDPHLGSNWIETGQDLSGKKIRVSFAVKAHNTTADIKNILIQRTTNDGSKPGTAVYLPVIKATDAWRTHTHTLTFPANSDNTSTRFRIVLRPEMDLAYQLPIYYDDIKVELVASAYEAGDFDQDGDIDLNDLRLLVQNIFGQNFTYDLNQDQRVDIFDYNVMLAKLQ